MYGWIWRRLPFGLPGKITGSVLLIAGAVVVLWLWVFPAVEPLLPFDDVQVGTDQPGVGGDAPTDDTVQTGTATPSGSSAASATPIPSIPTPSTPAASQRPT
jgi:hypothetical protein